MARPCAGRPGRRRSRRSSVWIVPQAAGISHRFVPRGGLAGVAASRQRAPAARPARGRARCPARGPARRPRTPAWAGPAARQSSAARHQLARELEVQLDRAARRCGRAWPAGRRSESTRHLDLDRRVRVAGSGRPPRRDERPLVHQEAEPQVVAGDRAEELAQPLARAQPPADAARSSPRPRASWPMNVTRPSSQLPRVAGLRDVVEQRGEAQRLRRG